MDTALVQRMLAIVPIEAFAAAWREQYRISTAVET
jgi:hypothetical protein